MEEFSKSFIAVATFAKEIETTVARIQRLLPKAGIDVLAIPYKQISVTSFFQRKDQETLWEQIRRNPTSKQRREVTSGNRSYSICNKLQSYLDALKENAVALPRRGTQPNKVVIAAACGIDRNALYLNQKVMMMLSAYDAEDRKRFKVRAQQTPATVLREYVEHLKNSGDLVPRRARRVNRKAIASACGINRNVLYSDSEVVDLLEKLDAE